MTPEPNIEAASQTPQESVHRNWIFRFLEQVDTDFGAILINFGTEFEVELWNFEFGGGVCIELVNI